MQRMQQSLSFPNAPTFPLALAHLLQSNEPPSNAESNLIAGYTDELESQLRLVVGGMAFLEMRRRELVQSAGAVQAIRSPIRRLPPEILSEIFGFAVSAAFHFGDIAEVSPPIGRAAPWLLTRICSHWSTVAVTNPALWSRVFLDLDRAGQRGMVPLTKLFLERSRNVPLSVKIFQESFGTSNLVLDVVMTYSDRWIMADLYMKVSGLNQLIPLHGRLSSLTTLIIVIDLANVENEELDEAFWNILAVTPNLRFLQTQSWDMFGFLRTPFTLAWDRLTRLSTTFESSTEALSLLGELSDIVECRLAFALADPLPAPIASRLISLPHLRRLALQIESADEEPVELLPAHPSLLDFLRTPSLQSLTTRGTADETAVLALIDRSECGPSLTQLRFHASSITQDVMLRLLAQMPQLSSLELGDFDGTLLPQTAMPTFLRALASEWVTRQASGGASHLHARLADGTYLNLNDAVAAELERMQADGLFLTIVEHPYYAGIILEPLFEDRSSRYERSPSPDDM
ncbi:hypothetical protein C8R46DRAFT_1227724 [Mycena filopes]|nr:hypothetical protein C8R46DRAFT_1227724 [Mycena filopes]